MARWEIGTERSANACLAMLSDEELGAFTAVAERVPLDFQRVLYEAEARIDSLWFPLRGVISLQLRLREGGHVEIATVGPDGFAGMPIFLGDDRAEGRALVQLGGEAWHIDAESFRRLLSEHGGLGRAASRYLQALFAFTAQNIGCIGAHSIGQRAARWMLMTHDRAGEDEFELTQRFLAQMLGVRRASVSEVQSDLQDRGVISYRRGRVRIVDREGLEREACECYGTVRKVFEDRLTPP